MDNIALNMSRLNKEELVEIEKTTKTNYNKIYPYIVYSDGEYFNAQSWLVSLRGYKLVDYETFISTIK